MHNNNGSSRNGNSRNGNSRNANSMSRVRVIHTVPDAPNVDVYADENLIVRDLAYGEDTDYLSVPEGRYRISLFVAGTSDDPVLTNLLNVNANTELTVAAAGTLDTIGFLAITDANKPMERNKAMVRFLHLSPNAPAVDITLPDGTVIFGNVAFKHITDYIAVDPMDYTLQVRAAGTDNVVLTVPDINLDEDEYYTVYAIGLAGDEPELEALLLPDGR